MTPTGRAVVQGFVAGIVGSFAQSAFFRLTRRLAPETPRDAFHPPEWAQRDEAATETVARRLVDDLMQRGPLGDEEKARAGRLVHYGFGGGWGVDYAIARERLPWLGSVGGTIAFATIVWAIGDDVLLPAFRLAAWPTRYPLRNHAYAWVAHLVYGFAVSGAYTAMERAADGSLRSIVGREASRPLRLLRAAA